MSVSVISHEASDQRGGRRRIVFDAAATALALGVATLLALLVPAALPPASAHAVSLRSADAAALSALGSAGGAQPVIVFRQRTPLRPGTVVAEAGIVRSAQAGAAAAPDRADRRDRLRRAGATVGRAPVVLRVGSEPAWLYYEDRGPFQLFEHPGRVALVGSRSGRVTLSRTLDWPPLAGGRLPLYLRSAAGYRSARHRVFARLPRASARGSARAERAAAGAAAAGSRAAARSAAGSRQRAVAAVAASAAARLAAEDTCAITVADMLDDSYDYASVDRTRAAFGGLLADLERRDRRFVAARYSTADALSPTAFVDRLVRRHGCRSVLLFIAGGGVRGGRTTISLGVSGHRSGRLEQQDLRGAELRALIAAHPDVDWQLLVDAPYAGGLVDELRSEPNLRVLLTASAADEPTHACIPGVARLCAGSSAQLAFTSRMIAGIEQLLSDAGALERAVAASSPNAPFAGRLLADGYELGAPAGALRRLGQHPRQYVNFGAPGAAPEQQSLRLPPFAHDQTVSTDEDTPIRIDLAAGDELQAALGSYAILRQPANGTVTGSGRSVTYTPNPNFDGTDSFQFLLRFAVVLPSVGSVTVNVRPVLDAPVVTTSAGDTTYEERGAAVAVDPSLTVTDGDSPTLTGATATISAGYVDGQDELAFADTPSITGSWDAARGELRLTGSAPVADYESALRSIAYANASSAPALGARTVSFTATDGVDVSAAAAKDVAVRAVNDRPVVTVAAGAVSYTENDPATAIDATLTVSDVDSPQLASATATIAGGHAPGEDLLDTTGPLPAGITASYDAAGGVLTLSGNAAVADYESALRAVGYRNAGEAPSTAPRTVELVATDTGGASSAVAAREVTVTPVNDGPVAGDDAYDTGADAILTVPAPGALANDDDAEGDPLTISALDGSAASVGTDVTTPSGATVRVNADGSLSYDPNGQFSALRPGQEESETFSYAVVDGRGGSDTATITVTVTGVNDGPDAADDGYVTDEDTVLTVPAPGVLANDGDDDGDALTVDQVDGSAARVGSSFTAGSGATVRIDADGSIRYDPAGQFDSLRPGEEVRDTVTYRVTDGAAQDSATVSFTITGVNDRPDAVDDAYGTDEDTPLTIAAPGALGNDSDPDSGATLTVDQVGGSAAGVGTAHRTARGATVRVGADGSISYDPTGAFDALRPGEETTDTITYRATDGVASDTATIAVTVSGVNDAPNGVADSYAGVGNTTLVVSDPQPGGEASKQLTGFVSDNDTDPDHAAAELSVRAESVATTLGGLATIDDDGSFTYVPPTGTTGADDSFEYEIGDGDRSDRGTVTIRLSERVWYVDNDEAAGGTGRSSDAFDTLAEAATASTAGDTIFVHAGDGTTRGMNAGVALDADERLLGEAADLVVGGDLLYDGAAARRPSIANAAGVGVALASGSHVEGLAVSAAGGAAISGAAGVTGSTLRDLTVSGSAGGVALIGTGGTTTIADTAISTTGGTGLAATGAGTLALTSAGTIGVRSVGGQAVAISGTALSGAIDAIGATGSVGGVSLQSTTGAIALGDVAVDVTGGTGFLADSVAGLSLPAAGAVSVRNTGGTAVAIRNSTAPSTTFDAVTATSGSATGVDVSGNGGGGTTTFSDAVTVSSGGATGVRLASNGGHAIAFAGGGLGVTSTGGDGFAATDGGTVTVTGAGNVVRSGTGTALRIVRTTIGAADATFQSLSADGGANGIVLDQTGTVGNLAVTGTGAADSGGTIRNVRGADGTTAGVGVYLNQTSGVALTALRLTNSDGHAIRGTAVDGFALDRSTIDGVHGTDDAVDEGAVRLNDLTGRASITSTAVSGGFEDNAEISSSRGTLALTLDGNTFGANSRDLGGNSVHLLAAGTADVTASVTRSTFTASREDLFQHSVTGTASSDFTFTGNTLSNDHPAPLGGSGLLVATSGDAGGADLSYSITGNRLTDMTGGGIFVVKGTGIADARGEISGNTIGTVGDVGSGAPIGSGITAESRGQGSHVVRIASNTIRQYNQNGIRTVNGEPSVADNGVVDVELTVTGNTVTEPSGALTTAVGFRNEAAHPDATVDECLDFRGNTMVGSAGPTGQEVRIRHIFTQNVVRLPGYAGGPEDDVAITSYLTANNTITAGRTGVVTPGGGAGYVNGGAGCTQPTP